MRITILTIIFALICVSNSYANIESYPTPVKAIYGFSSKNEPFKTMNTNEMSHWLKEHGINAVFFYQNEKLDVLKLLKENDILCFQEISIFTGRTLYENHPEWRPIGKDGKAIKPDGWYHGLSPNQPELRQKRLNDFKKRLENPYLDGIWLDFIRYPVRWEGKNPRMEQSCFSQEALNQFKEYLGSTLPKYNSTKEISEWILNNKKNEWTQFKINTINSWVELAKKIRDELRPEVTIGLFGVPWLKSDFDNAIKTIVAQDFNQLAEHVDIFSPMVYHKLCYRDVDWIGNVTDVFQNMTNKPVWPIIQAVSDPVELSDQEFKQSIQVGLDHSGEGIILFTAQHAENENRWDEIQAVLTEY